MPHKAKDRVNVTNAINNAPFPQAWRLLIAAAALRIVASSLDAVEMAIRSLAEYYLEHQGQHDVTIRITLLTLDWFKVGFNLSAAACALQGFLLDKALLS